MEPDIKLEPNEARIFGVLIEKQLTTPDQYPLSLNAATNGANQKSNRDPVVSLEEDEVAAAIDGLEKKYLVRRVFSRVERYQQTGKETLKLDYPELAILAELLMRGPQMPGELRARVSRMSEMESIGELMTRLALLIERGFVQRIGAAPGSRSERYVQLLSPGLHPLDAPALEGPAEIAALPAGRSSTSEQLAALEARVDRLEKQIKTLADRLGEALPEDQPT
jgi:uncharacterized protein YceH (UPF0502 family)